MGRVIADNAFPTRLVDGGDERLVAITVRNIGTQKVELFTESGGKAGLGFPMIPGAEYQTVCAGRVRLWVLSIGPAPSPVAVTRETVERVPKAWEWKGPVDDMLIARLPFDEAQAQLRAPARTSTAVLAPVEWHGSSEYGDPEVGSFAIVDEDGPLAGLVGDRVQVSFEGRAVFAYVHRSGVLLDAQISLTRRLFHALAPLSTTVIDATVAVAG